MYSENFTSEFQNMTSPAAGKKMKDIVPYTEAHLKLLQVIGSDIADDIPDEHEEDAEFVISRSGKDRYGDQGRYTGWMRNGKMNGRGTFILDGDGDRFDSTWKDDMMHGTGRWMGGDGSWATQGACANDDWVSPWTSYTIDGTVRKF